MEIRANPLATPAQRTIEDRALALLDHPDVKRARGDFDRAVEERHRLDLARPG